MQYPKQTVKKKFFVQGIKILNLSSNKLKLIAKNRGIKDYKNKSKDELTKILSKPEPKITIEKIIKKFNESRDRFSKSKIKLIRRNLYEKNPKNNLSTPEIKEIEKKSFYTKKGIMITMILNTKE